MGFRFAVRDTGWSFALHGPTLQELALGFRFASFALAHGLIRSKLFLRSQVFPKRPGFAFQLSSCQQGVCGLPGHARIRPAKIQARALIHECEMKEGSHRKHSTSSFADRGFVCFPRTSESCRELLCGQMPKPSSCTAANAAIAALSADTTCAGSMCRSLELFVSWVQSPLEIS